MPGVVHLSLSLSISLHFSLCFPISSSLIEPSLYHHHLIKKGHHMDTHRVDGELYSLLFRQTSKESMFVPNLTIDQSSIPKLNESV